MNIKSGDRVRIIRVYTERAGVVPLNYEDTGTVIHAPEIGSAFYMHADHSPYFRSSKITEVDEKNQTFQTINSVYKWEKLNEVTWRHGSSLVHNGKETMTFVSSSGDHYPVVFPAMLSPQAVDKVVPAIVGFLNWMSNHK